MAKRVTLGKKATSEMSAGFVQAPDSENSAALWNSAVFKEDAFVNLEYLSRCCP